MSRTVFLLEQICIARQYTESLLIGLDQRDWFRQPREGVTHVAWQVGHLAFAEYHLAQERIRGRQPEDAELITDGFLQLFRRGSVPDPNPARYPHPKEIRETFGRVHQRTIENTEGLRDETLDEPIDPPHARFRTKFGALQWCSLQEMLHAGQIGLLRRLLGMKPFDA